MADPPLPPLTGIGHNHGVSDVPNIQRQRIDVAFMSNPSQESPQGLYIEANETQENPESQDLFDSQDTSVLQPARDQEDPECRSKMALN